MASWVFLTYCFVNCILFLLLNHLNWSSSLRPPEKNLRRVSLRKDQGARSPTFVPQDLLSQFLSTLNITEQKVDGSKEPLEFMLELYERFTKDPRAVPSANIVRSFKNEDSSPFSETSDGARIFPLLFNISMPHQEHVALAELRLFIQIQEAKGVHQGPDCRVSVYHVQEGVGRSRGGHRDARSSAEEEVPEIKDLEELVTKHINSRDNGWVLFDLTRAVTRWQKSGRTSHRLEVHVISSVQKRKNTSGINIDLDRSLGGKQNAAMIVFSANQSKDHSKGSDKLNLVVEEENPLRNERGSLWRQLDHNTDHENQKSDFIYDTPSRIRRSLKSDACKRTPLFVDFKDIGWDNWIIQPLGYDAFECKGECYPPLTSEVTPTRHAMVQTLLSVKSPDRVSRACCVPTKLEPISLLYHENGVITFNHKYEGMVVAECGCR